MEGRLHENLSPQMCRFTAPPICEPLEMKILEKNKNTRCAEMTKPATCVPNLTESSIKSWWDYRRGVQKRNDDWKCVWWQTRLDACFRYNMNHIRPGISSFSQSAYTKRAFLFPRRGHMKRRDDGQRHWHNWLGNDTTRHDTDMRATPTNTRTTFNGKKKKKTCSGALSALSPLSGLGEKWFQSSSLAWSGRGAVRNVLNGRSMRRRVWNDYFYWRQPTD